MGKLALLAIAVIAALLWFRYKAGAETRAARAASRAQPSRSQVQRMVQCANCGVHLPSAEALLDAQGEPFCSAAHRSAGKPAA